MLRAEYEQRLLRNRRFSLRAFAALLGMDSSTLSQILRGRRRLSARMTAAVCARLTGFVARSRPLARRLRLRTDDVNAALARLLRDGRVRMLSTTRWAVTGSTKER